MAIFEEEAEFTGSKFAERTDFGLYESNYQKEVGPLIGFCGGYGRILLLTVTLAWCRADAGILLVDPKARTLLVGRKSAAWHSSGTVKNVSRL